MAAVGYAGFYKRRTGTQTDGVATFYRTDKYDDLHSTIYVFTLTRN